MKLLIVLCGLAVASAIPLNVQRAYESELKEILEVFRSKMSVGIPDLGVPALDPYKREALDVSVNLVPTIEAEMTFRGIVAKGLSEFIINSISMENSTRTIFCDVNIPALKISIDRYTLSGYVFEETEVYGDGRADIFPKNMVIKGSFVLKEKADKFLEMADFDIAMTMESLKTDIQNLQGGGDTGDQANQLIESVVPQLVQDEKELISSIVGNFAKEFSDAYLGTLTVQDFYDLLHGVVPLPKA